jgi:triacylglycerol esterase/lipase EstA (alpha/beta hydrolase family)
MYDKVDSLDPRYMWGGQWTVSHVHVPHLWSYVDYVSKQSYAMLTEESEAHHVVIFVHGFGGHPFKTWCQMQNLITSDDGWKETDAYFIGYNSIRDEVMLSAAYIARIIRQICPEPPGSLFMANVSGATYQLRSYKTTYDSIDLVGHSLGGVVLRAALLQLLRQGFAAVDSSDVTKLPAPYSFPCSARVRLFAPAQGGARIAGLKGMIRHTVGLRALIELYRGNSPSFQELEPGSLLLQALREDINYYADQYPGLNSLHARIAWAQNDRIVTSLPFRHDASYTILDTDHLTVCKPSLTFPAPFTFVNTGILEREDGAL